MEEADVVGSKVLLGKYEIGRILGEGNFGKVKYARHMETGHAYAIKILNRRRIIDLKIDDQIKREIGTLKLLKHPNIVRLYEPDNVLIDAKGNIKVSDFGLSALSQNIRNDGLLHTTCGSPHYIAPEVISNRGYDGAMSDIWSCSVILYLILTGCLPFTDRNMVVLYQKISKGHPQFPKWFPLAAQSMIRRILDPNPKTRIHVAGIKADDWFNQDYKPAVPYGDAEYIDTYNTSLFIKQLDNVDDYVNIPSFINAFQLIAMSSSLDLSGFFEQEDISERKIRFTSTNSPKDMFQRIEDIVKEMGFDVQKGHGKLKVMQQNKGSTSPRSPGSLSVAAEVFQLSPSLYVVELWKSYGDSALYRELCRKISNDLGVYKSSSC